jgi:hypothetical protein
MNDLKRVLLLLIVFAAAIGMWSASAAYRATGRYQPITITSERDVPHPPSAAVLDTQTGTVYIRQSNGDSGVWWEEHPQTGTVVSHHTPFNLR